MIRQVFATRIYNVKTNPTGPDAFAVEQSQTHGRDARFQTTALAATDRTVRRSRWNGHQAAIPLTKRERRSWITRTAADRR